MLGTTEHVRRGAGGRGTKVKCFRRVCIGLFDNGKNKYITSDLWIIGISKRISVCTLWVAATACVVSIIRVSIAPIFVIHHRRVGWGLQEVRIDRTGSRGGGGEGSAPSVVIKTSAERRRQHSVSEKKNRANDSAVDQTPRGNNNGSLTPWLIKRRAFWPAGRGRCWRDCPLFTRVGRKLLVRGSLELGGGAEAEYPLLKKIK